MGSVVKKILTVCVIFIAYYLFNPLPPDIERPLRFCLSVSSARMIEDVAKVTHFLGISDQRRLRRSLSARFLAPKTISESSDILTVNDTYFDDVQVRIYSPKSEHIEKARPGFIYMHGGGFIIGNIDFCDEYLARIAQDSGVVVVSVEYRLSPENPAPAALEDVEKATRYIYTHSSEWNIDPSKIGIGGDGSGGTLAAALSLKLRDEGWKMKFAYQILTYPWTQAIDFGLPSYIESDKFMNPTINQNGMIINTLSYIGIDLKYADNFRNNSHITKATRQKYSDILKLELLPGFKEAKKGQEEPYVNEQLAEQVEPLVTNPYNFPLMAKDFSGLPPTLVQTVGLDTVRDDGILFMQRLKDSGIETEHYHDSTCWHAALQFAFDEKPVKCGLNIFENVLEYIKKKTQ